MRGTARRGEGRRSGGASPSRRRAAPRRGAARACPAATAGVASRGAIGAVAIGAVVALAVPLTPARAAEPPAADVREVAPGHFVRLGRQQDMTLANDGDVANGGFVVGTRAVAVIDPGGSVAAARALRAALRERTTLPVGHVLLTHFHPDHVLGARVFGAAGALVAHVNYARSRTQRGAFYLERFGALAVAPEVADDTDDAVTRGAAADVPAADAATRLDVASALPAPTREVRPGAPLTIELGARTLVVRAHVTGHTDNDLSVFDPDSATLWAGDLLFAARTPALDGSLPGWLAVLDELAALEPRVAIPGHGEPAGFDAIAAPQRRYLETLLDGTRRALAEGGRLADALAAAERADPGGWLLFERQHPTNVTRAWSELEWE